MTEVDDLLVFDDHILHAVHEGPAYASTTAGIDESVLWTCVQGIFSIHELRMKDNIALLRVGLHVRKTLPVYKVLRPCHTGCRNC